MPIIENSVLPGVNSIRIRQTVTGEVIFSDESTFYVLKRKQPVQNMVFGERKTHSRMFTENYYWRW